MRARLVRHFAIGKKVLSALNASVCSSFSTNTVLAWRSVFSTCADLPFERFRNIFFRCCYIYLDTWISFSIKLAKITFSQIVNHSERECVLFGIVIWWIFFHTVHLFLPSRITRALILSVRCNAIWLNNSEQKKNSDKNYCLSVVLVIFNSAPKPATGQTNGIRII